MTQRALIFAGHRMHRWWGHLGLHSGFDAWILTDRRGEGDLSTVDDFYRATRRFLADGTNRHGLLSDEELRDVIARCRTLRWLPPPQANAMALGMAQAMEAALDKARPDVLLSLTTDSFVYDVLSRRAAARGVPHYEMTGSALPGMTMIAQRGVLSVVDREPPPEQVEAMVAELVDPLYAPPRFTAKSAFTKASFFRTLTYFRLRAKFFKAYSWVKRDPWNVHYLDAQPWLGHKAKYSDVRVLSLINHDWQDRLCDFEREKRILFALQLFPEASIDYWIPDRALIAYEDVIERAASVLSAAGYQIVVKDHPLQFGFRQAGLIGRLKRYPNVVILPYEVSSLEILQNVGTNFTTTGTPGLQSAMMGLNSIIVPNYYSTDDRDFFMVNRPSDIELLPDRLPAGLESDVADRQRRIVTKLLRGSFDADILSFQRFDPANPTPQVRVLGEKLGERIRELETDRRRREAMAPAA